MARLPPSLGTYNFKVGLKSIFSAFLSLDFLEGGVSRNSVLCRFTQLRLSITELFKHTEAEAPGPSQVGI